MAVKEKCVLKILLNSLENNENLRFTYQRQWFEGQRKKNSF